MRRTIIEAIKIALALIGAGLIARGAAWSVPHAERTIWHVAYLTMAAVIFAGIRPLRVAWRADHREPQHDG